MTGATRGRRWIRAGWPLLLVVALAGCSYEAPIGVTAGGQHPAIVIPSCIEDEVEEVSVSDSRTGATLWSIVALDALQRADLYEVGQQPPGFDTRVELAGPLPDDLVAQVTFVENASTPGPSATQAFELSKLDSRFVWFREGNHPRSELDQAAERGICGDHGGLSIGLIVWIALGGLACLGIPAVLVVVLVTTALRKRSPPRPRPVG